jgi:hypothetical protein
MDRPLVNIGPISAWADFSIMMECTPESCYCHSVCTLLCGTSHCEKMYIMYCTVSTIRCELYNVHCVQYELWSVESRMVVNE